MLVMFIGTSENKIGTFLYFFCLLE